MMSPGTGLSLVGAGVSLWFFAQGGERANLFAVAASVVPIALGATSASQYFIGGNFGLGEGLFKDSASVQSAFPGRTGLNTALGTTLAGLALLAINYAPLRLLAQIGALGSGLIGFFALLGYAFSVASLAGVGTQAPMAIHTAAALTLLSTGIFLARGEGGLLSASALTVEGSVVTSVLLFSLLGITAWLWYTSKEDAARDARAAFDFEASQVRDRIFDRIAKYELVLLSGRALFATGLGLDRAAWRAYVGELDIERTLPGARGVGFGARVLPGERDTYVRSMRAEGISTYAVRPAGARPIYVPIVYLEPSRGGSLREVGHDMYADPVQREAMTRAVALGRPTVSDKVMLEQEAGEDAQAGFILFVPVYRKGAPQKTETERAAALTGFIFSAFGMADFVRAALAGGARLVGVEIYSGQSASDEALLYRHGGVASSKRATALVREDVIEIGGRPWTLRLYSVPGFDSTLAPDRPDLVLYGGIVTSLLITGIAVSLYTSRARAITLARRMTAKLRAGNERLEREIELRKQADEALRQIGIRFRAISDASPLGIFVVDADGKSHYTNPAWQRINGLTLAQSMADGWSAAIHPEDRERVLRERAAALTARAPYHNEYRLQRSDGAVIWVRVNSSAIYDEGRLLGYVGLLEDITSRRQMEETLARKTAELERSNTELQQFASVASHDLQEPLRTVTSYTQLIMRRYRDKLDSDAGEFMDYIVEGTTRMRQLIEDLLALSRVGSNAGEFTPVSTGEVLDEALAALRAVIQETEAVVHRESLPVVSADRRQLVQVFVNLIANGIKFRGDVSPKIDISARANGAEWIFSIADNGIGIEPQYLERIFVIFQRLHTRSEYPGTGIGLAICKKIVERHGGRIWFESALGQGATFFFTLPSRS